MYANLETQFRDKRIEIVIVLAIMLLGGGFLLLKNLRFIPAARLDEREIAILGDLLARGPDPNNIPMSPGSTGNFFVQGANALATYTKGSGYPLGHLPTELQTKLRTNYPGVTSPGWVWRYFRSPEYTATFEKWSPHDDRVTLHVFNDTRGYYLVYARIEGSWQRVETQRDVRH